MSETLGMPMQVNAVHRMDSAPGTPLDSPVVKALSAALMDVGQVQARPTGIGGSTVAVYLRRMGLQAVVWSRLLSNCHEPEEKSLISNTIFDAQIFTHVLYSVDI